MTERPTDVRYFTGHDSATLRVIVERYTADSLAMWLNGGEEVAKEAIAIANNAWAELVMRGEETA